MFPLKAIPAVHADPFFPVLQSSMALAVTGEQINAIGRVIDKTSADSRFAEKAKAAITAILTQGSVTIPVLVGISPTTAAAESVVTIACTGQGFSEDSVIYVNGNPVMTVFGSDNLVSVEDLSLAGVVPGALSIRVVNPPGIVTEPQYLTITAAEVP